MANATPPDAGIPVGGVGGAPGAPAASQRLRRQHQRRVPGSAPTMPLLFDIESKPNSPHIDLFKTITGSGPLRWAEMSDRAHNHSGEVSDTLDRLLVEHDAEATLKCMQKEMHEERLKHLRGLMTEIKDDDWRYEPVEKLLGFQ